MATHLVGSASSGAIRLSTGAVFSTKHEVHAVPSSEWSSSSERGARFVCQRGAPARSCGDCEMCTRFVAFHRDETGELVVECHWSARDPVSARMTAATALVTVSPDTPCGAALELARARRVHHLPVLEDGSLVGIVCRCDLSEPSARDEAVRYRMSTEILALDNSARLGEAIAAMQLFKIACLPVIAGGLLVGVITAGDLVDVGVPEVLLGRTRCTRCGTAHCVRATPRAPGVGLCVECLRHAAQDLEALGLGEAD